MLHAVTLRLVPIPKLLALLFACPAWSDGTLVGGALSAMGDNVLLWCIEKNAFSAKVFFYLPPVKQIPVAGEWAGPPTSVFHLNLHSWV